MGNQKTATSVAPSSGGEELLTYSTTFTARDEVLAQTNPDSKVTTYAWTGVVNRRETMLDPDEGLTTWLYDDSGRQDRIIDPRGKTTTMTFDTASRQKTRTTPDCVNTTWTYDPAGNMTVIDSTKQSSGTPVNRLTLTYDKVNNRSRASSRQDGGEDSVRSRSVRGTSRAADRPGRLDAFSSNGTRGDRSGTRGEFRLGSAKTHLKRPRAESLGGFRYDCPAAESVGGFRYDCPAAESVGSFRDVMRRVGRRRG